MQLHTNSENRLYVHSEAIEVYRAPFKRFTAVSDYRLEVRFGLSERLESARLGGPVLVQYKLLLTLFLSAEVDNGE